MTSTIKYGIIILVVAVVVIGGGYYLHNSTASPAVTAQTPAAKSFELVVKDRKVISGDTTFVVKKGDTVSITITANESDELHLHGYDLHVDFATDTPATLTFTADQSGRFSFEMEGSATELGEVEVQP